MEILVEVFLVIVLFVMLIWKISSFITSILCRSTKAKEPYYEIHRSLKSFFGFVSLEFFREMELQPVRARVLNMRSFSRQSPRRPIVLQCAYA